MLGLLLVVSGIFSLAFSYRRFMHDRTCYREDEYCFEIFKKTSDEQIAVRYDEITAWNIVRIYSDIETDELHLKTTGFPKKIVIDLYQIRPLILLKTLFSMEKEGRFNKAGKRKGSRINMRLLCSEYYRQVQAVREEIQKTGASIPIPDSLQRFSHPIATSNGSASSLALCRDRQPQS